MTGGKARGGRIGENTPVKGCCGKPNEERRERGYGERVRNSGFLKRKP